MVKRTNWSGIALIEVLVSIVLIGLGLVAIVSGFDVSIRTMGRCQDTEVASMLLEDVLMDAFWVQKLEAGATLTGRCDSPNNRFSYDVKSQSLETVPFLKITATIRWQDGGRERQVTARRVVLR